MVISLLYFSLQSPFSHILTVKPQIRSHCAPRKSAFEGLIEIFIERMNKFWRIQFQLLYSGA